MFYVNDEPEGKFLYTETIKLYSIVLLLQLLSVEQSWRRTLDHHADTPILPSLLHNYLHAQRV